MAKFEFKLEPLKKFRENRVAAARREMMLVQNKLLDLAEQQRAAFAARGEALETGDPNLLVRRSTMIESETRRIALIQKEMRVLEEDLDRHRRWVTHLSAELKAIEKLEEKKRAEFEIEQRILEKRKVDRWTSENWARLSALRNEESA